LRLKFLIIFFPVSSHLGLDRRPKKILTSWFDLPGTDLGSTEATTKLENISENILENISANKTFSFQPSVAHSRGSSQHQPTLNILNKFRLSSST
jgi:hypothetical protein